MIDFVWANRDMQVLVWYVQLWKDHHINIARGSHDLSSTSLLVSSASECLMLDWGLVWSPAQPTSSKDANDDTKQATCNPNLYRWQSACVFASHSFCSLCEQKFHTFYIDKTPCFELSNYTHAIRNHARFLWYNAEVGTPAVFPWTSHAA